MKPGSPNPAAPLFALIRHWVLLPFSGHAGFMLGGIVGEISRLIQDKRILPHSWIAGMNPECHDPCAMSNFISTKVPIWRLVLYGLLAIGAFAWLGHTFDDRKMIWIGVFVVPLLIVLMLGIIQAAQGQWAKQNLRLIIWIYIILQSALLIWTLIEKK